MHKSRWCWLLAGVLAAAALTAQAVPVAGLYSATVPVADESDGQRTQALRRALSRVMGRIAGDPQAARLSGADSVLAQADSLVQQYGYRGRAANQEDADLRLRAVFDGQTLQRAMRDAGLPIWGRDRPRILVWLALGDALLTEDGPGSAAAALFNTARARGIPVRLPRPDSQEITAADIAAGRDARIAAVSRGYESSLVLIGEASASGETWRADWRLLDDGQAIADWNDSAASQGSLVATATGRSADILARRYAVTAGGAAETVALAVDGIRGANGYTRVERLLAGLAAVNSVSPAVIDGESVLFRVEAAGGAQALERGIATTDWLDRDEVAQNFARLNADGESILGYRVGR